MKRFALVTRNISTAVALFTALLAAPLLSSDADPWTKNELLDAAVLAKEMKSSNPPTTVICVAFNVLYRQRHIEHAKYAGPGNKAEGIDDLKKLVASLPKTSDIVLYCGCCPMDRCPNIRPAYQALRELGFSHVRVLSMPTNFHTDWASKGYPVE